MQNVLRFFLYTLNTELVIFKTEEDISLFLLQHKLNNFLEEVGVVVDELKKMYKRK